MASFQVCVTLFMSHFVRLSIFFLFVPFLLLYCSHCYYILFKDSQEIVCFAAKLQLYLVNRIL